MIDSKIGYMICETASSEPQTPVVVSSKGDRVTIEAILQDLDVKNRNGRYYSVAEMKPELTCQRTVELIESGNMLGEAGHPMSKDITRQQTIDPTNTSHKILKLWLDGKDIKAHVKGTPNMRGEEFNNFILDDTKVSFSLRALGSVTNTNRGAEVKNIRIITWDWVVYPSHKRAYMSNIVNESAGLVDTNGNKLVVQESDKGLITPITNQQVIDYIKTESANVNSVLNSFDTLYESIDLVNNNRTVQMVASNGDTFMINLESYIRNEIMDYCTNRY